MKNKLRMVTSLLLAFIVSIGSVSLNVSAEQGTDSEIQLVSKSATLVDRETNSYEISVNVPGADGTNYYEVIVMLDASGSQFSNLDELKDTVRDLGVDILRENNSIKLTLMHFGISGATLFSVSNPTDLEIALNDLTYEELERWPTATNCEGSFTHIIDHVNNSADLEKAFIVYISDGETNMSDEPRNWMDWKEHNEWHYGSWTTQKVVETTFSEEIKRITNGEEPCSATKEQFKELVETSADVTSLVTSLKTVTLDEKTAWMDLTFKHAYEQSGLDVNTEYPVSVVEKAFIKAHGMESSGHYGFAYVCLGASSLDAHSYNWDTNTSASSYLSPTKGQKAAAKANELASMDKVRKLYFIGMAGNGASGKSVLTSWMNPSEENIANGTAKVFASSEKLRFADGTNDTTEVNGVMEEIKSVGNTLRVTPYNNVSLVSYTSKWMNIDPTSLKVYDGNQLICAYNDETQQYESVVDTTRLRFANTVRSSSPIISVDLVDSSEYSNGGTEVEGNTSGDIYKLTWNVKDGALLLADDYRLTYTATTDTSEDNFDYGTNYLSNGNTDITYSDQYGDIKTSKIASPNINATKEVGGNNVITSNTSQDVMVKANIDSSFNVTVPKEIVLINEVGGTGVYEAELPITVQGDIGTSEKIKVTIGSLELTDEIETKQVEITCGKTEFNFDDLKDNAVSRASHSLKAKLTPGKWFGIAQITVELLNTEG